MSDLIPWLAPYTGWALMGLLASAGILLAIKGGRTRGFQSRSVLCGIVVALALPTFAVARRTYQHGAGYWLRYGPVYWISPFQKIETKIIGPFVVTVHKNRRAYVLPPRLEAFARVNPGGLIVPGNHAAIYHWYADPAPGNGTDLTGNNLPNLVLGTHAGGKPGPMF